MADNPVDVGDFVDKFPMHRFTTEGAPELLHKGPESYAGLDEGKEGDWRVIRSNGLPIGVAWTDWDTGFNINILEETEATQRLRTYPAMAKASGVPAPWAYTTLEQWIKSFDKEDGVTLDPPSSGVLSGVYRASGGVPSYGTLVPDNDE